MAAAQSSGHGDNGSSTSVAETPLPTRFVERLAERLSPAEVAQVLRSMHAPKRVAYWSNPLRPDGLDAGAAESLMVGPERLHVVPPAERSRVTGSRAAERGGIYPINPSSVRAVQALAPEPGEEVLDLAAAPGGKTLLIAAAMANRGRIAAVEVVKPRFFRLKANLERCGVAIATCYLADGRSIGRKTPERFDRVLLDAPCSSEARFRAGDETTFAHWSPAKVKESARKQKGLVRSAFRALRPGGRMVYCTCTFAVEENEAIVDYLARREPAVHVEECCRILPDDVWDGFFYAVMEKA